MTIYIDADGCPVVDITVRLAAKYGVRCVIICDTAHRIEREGAETIIVGQGNDSVDFRLVNLLKSGDIAVTQDYGLAAMCLGRSAIVLNQDGKRYSDDNISGLLEFRAVGKKLMRSGGRLKGAPKRTARQNEAFAHSLEAVLNEYK